MRLLLDTHIFLWYISMIVAAHVPCIMPPHGR